MTAASSGSRRPAVEKWASRWAALSPPLGWVNGRLPRLGEVPEGLAATESPRLSPAFPCRTFRLPRIGDKPVAVHSPLDAYAAAFDARGADRIRETLAWIAPHCDLEERLPRIPPSALVRGIWGRILSRQLQERGLLQRYRELLPMPEPGALSFYPAGDLCVQAAVAGALVSGPDELHQGMFEITRDNSRRFAASLLGRTLLRLLAKDPRRLAQQAIASRRQTCNYGSWELLEASEREVRIYLREEYVWIESYLLGAAVGTFEALGEVEAHTELEDPFHGVHVIRLLGR